MVVEFDPLTWGQPVRGLEWKNERCIEIPIGGWLAKFNRPGRVLDAGCALNVIMPVEPVAEITHFTNTLAYEKQQMHPNRTYIEGDLRDLSRWPDGYFDRVICVSTLEHVGMDNSNYGGEIETDPASAVTAAQELQRVAGERLFLTVPVSLTRRAEERFRYFTPETLPSITPMGADTAYYAKFEDGWAGPFPAPQTTSLAAGKVNQIAAVLWRG